MLGSAVEQHALAINAHISPPSWASLPPHFHPTPLGHQRALSWAPLLYSSFLLFILHISSVQFSRSVVSDSLWPHGPQHVRPPCPPTTPRVYSNSCPSNRWCHPTISSSVVPFPSCLQSFPTSGSFPMSQFFASGSQSIGHFTHFTNFTYYTW